MKLTELSQAEWQAAKDAQDAARVASIQQAAGVQKKAPTTAPAAKPATNDLTTAPKPAATVKPKRINHTTQAAAGKPVTNPPATTTPAPTTPAVAPATPSPVTPVIKPAVTVPTTPSPIRSAINTPVKQVMGPNLPAAPSADKFVGPVAPPTPVVPPPTTLGTSTVGKAASQATNMVSGAGQSIANAGQQLATGGASAVQGAATKFAGQGFGNVAGGVTKTAGNAVGGIGNAISAHPALAAGAGLVGAGLLARKLWKSRKSEWADSDLEKMITEEVSYASTEKSSQVRKVGNQPTQKREVVQKEVKTPEMAQPIRTIQVKENATRNYILEKSKEMISFDKAEEKDHEDHKRRLQFKLARRAASRLPFVGKFVKPAYAVYKVEKSLENIEKSP